MRLTIGGLIAAAFALSIGIYSRLPATMATHWAAAGNVDGYRPKAVGAFLAPALMIVITAIFGLLPRISPRGWDIEGRSRAFRAIVLTTVAVIFAIHLFVLAASLGIPMSAPMTFSALLGVLFVILGNYMTKFRRNFFIGIRTPWTLADEDVWFRTHRLGSRVFVIAGLILITTAPFFHEFVFLTVAGLAAAIPAIYSFIVYRQLTAESNHQGSSE